MSLVLNLRAGCLVLLAATSCRLAATPLFNEIMFHPAGIPEITAREFIEIHNPTELPVDLTGWRLDRGVTFTFSAVIVPPNGFIVVAANVATFQARYPSIANVVGPWTGSLSNSEETIRLLDSVGVEVDSVHYATQGDWGRRVREATWNGWDWESLADGGGRSLELINPALGNNNGQNWVPGNANDGTPGQANSTADGDVAPLIKDIRHRPIVPTSNDPITISCDIEDEAAGWTATLFWRVSSNNPPAFATTPMAPDVNGRFKAVLPSHPNRTIIEFYIQSSDGTNTRTWPAPTSEGQNANALLQVDNEVLPANQCSARLILSVQENNEFQNSNSNSDREYNLTLITDFGSGMDVRYRTGMRIRGASSRTHNPRPMRMAIPNDDKINGFAVFNLNPKYTYLQYLGAKLFQAAGLRAADTRPIQIRRNGINNARNDDFDYGRWAMVEHLDGDFVDHHWPLDSAGNLYKKVRPHTSWAYRNGNVQQYLADGFTKETNSSANNWSDLDAFMAVMSANPASSDYLPDIQFNGDVPQWMRWFALENLIANGETNASNGADDDYSFYRGTIGRKFQFIPHDLDTILGWGDQDRIENPSYTLFDMTEQGDRGEIIDKLVPFFGTTTGGAAPGIRQAYFSALRDLATTLFEPASFGNLVDSHLAGWVDQGRIDAIKSFMAARRTFVLDTVTPEVGPFTPVAPTSIGTLSAPRTAPVVINEVLAHNVAGFEAAGLFPDAVELRNYTGNPVDLTGKMLTDDPTDKSKYIFTSGITIPADGYVILFGGSPPNGGSGESYLNFALAQEGAGLFFYDAEANGGGLIDSITFGPQAADLSIGRTGADGDVWRLGTPTLGVANSTQATGDVAQVRLNEWLANPDFRVENDFLELYNPLTSPVALGGVRITDDFINYPSRHVLPALSFIGPQSFSLFRLEGNAATATNPSDLPFKFDSLGGWAAILGGNGVTIDRIDMDCQFRDVSGGRNPDGAIAVSAFSIPTPGLPNTAPPVGLEALLDHLRITEFNYNPQPGTFATNDYEFLELYNTGDAPLDLTGVRLSEGVQFIFPTYILAPDAYVVIVRNLQAFESRYGAGRPVAGVYSGSLDNSGEIISLTLPNPWDVNILSYRYERFWQSSTDGVGYTLEIIGAENVAPRDWSDRDSWVAGALLHGTPGAASPPVITSPLAANGVAGAPFTYTILATNNPAAYSASGLPGGLNINTSTGLISGNPAASGTFNVLIGANNSGGQDQETLVLNIAQQPPPSITSPLSVAGLVGGSFTYQITADNFPTSFSASGHPAWMVFTAATGQLSGTPTAGGTFNITIGATNASGTDTEMLVVQIVTDEIAAAVDSNELTFTRGGSTGAAQWFAQSDNAFDGEDAAESGDIGNNQSTWIETTVVGPRQISFWWAVSSQPSQFGGNDSLQFRVDNTVVAEISGDISWLERTFQIPAGPHVLQWRYRKNNFGSTGADAGWVDRITLGDPDTDNDGLSDPWETANFGTLTRDGTGDFDNDGQTDRSEYLAGTIPNNPNSLFALREIVAGAGNEYSLTWDSVVGRTYQAQVSTDLQTWFDVGSPVIANASTASLLTSPPTTVETDVTFVAEQSPTHVLVPAADIGTLWRGGDEPAFLAAGGDASWLTGNSGIGYDTNPEPVNYLTFIGINVGPPPLVNNSIYCRFRFNVVDPAAISTLTLRVRCDDGFASWINGQSLPASFLSPNADPPWDATATQSTTDDAAIVFRNFVLPGPYTYLHTGENILAIQSLNQAFQSSDLLMQPVLDGTQQSEISTEQIFWRMVIVP